MVGMYMGFQDHADREALVFGFLQDGIGRLHVGLARLVVIIEDGIDHGRLFRLRIGDEIAHRIRRLIEEGMDDRFAHARAPFCNFT